MNEPTRRDNNGHLQRPSDAITATTRLMTAIGQRTAVMRQSARVNLRITELIAEAEIAQARIDRKENPW